MHRRRAIPHDPVRLVNLSETPFPPVECFASVLVLFVVDYFLHLYSYPFRWLVRRDFDSSADPLAISARQRFHFVRVVVVNNPQR